MYNEPLTFSVEVRNINKLEWFLFILGFSNFLLYISVAICYWLHCCFILLVVYHYFAIDNCLDKVLSFSSGNWIVFLLPSECDVVGGRMRSMNQRQTVRLRVSAQLNANWKELAHNNIRSIFNNLYIYIYIWFYYGRYKRN